MNYYYTLNSSRQYRHMQNGYQYRNKLNVNNTKKQLLNKAKLSDIGIYDAIWECVVEDCSIDEIIC